MRSQALNGETLDDIIQRVVEIAQPEQVILFGSAARGDMGPNSDVDLLVVKDGANRRGLSARIRRNLYGIRAAVDVIVVTPDDLERFKDSHGLVIKPALREGTVVYEAA
jgi:predicted nucleotidyltransferase